MTLLDAGEEGHEPSIFDRKLAEATSWLSAILSATRKNLVGGGLGLLDARRRPV